MAVFSYRIVNVFTQGGMPLSGNPLCVFERAQALDAARMQALALQFNLSETSFILPSERASARVRIFTPRYEMPFAGHPTLGTAHVCRALGLGGDRLTLAGMLGLEERELGERPLWVNAGVEQLIVPLASEAAVRRVNVRTDLLAQLQSADGHSMVYVFAPAGAGLLARFFFPQGSALLEDPATGSATANLGGWCLATGRTLPCEFEISQGEYTGRPSALRLRVEDERNVLVSGEVIELGRGAITL